MPPSLLKAVGWVESGWRQFDAGGRPLVAPDFGYGIMQITSGMPGAFGSVRGSIPPDVQTSVASNYAYNIAFGAKMLVDKWNTTPRIGTGDPSVVENWYYALWAYNGWGWVNNPNNPRFTRDGTPAQNPSAFPYQERVLYLVQHPPRDAAGNPRWKPVKVWMPSASMIGNSPHSYIPAKSHAEPVAALSAVYRSAATLAFSPGSTGSVPVKVQDTGTLPWPATGTLAVSLTYHLMTASGNPWSSLSPFSAGVVAFAQGQTPLPHDVLPGQTVTLHVPLKAPSGVAAYRVVWDLQQGTDTWFSQQGALPLAATLHVGSDGTPTATPSPTATPTATVTENAAYVRDTSVPDGSVLATAQVFDKGWLLFNNGRVAWGPGWTVRHVSGTTFGLKSAPLPATPACRSLNLVESLHAPRHAGAFTGIWRIFDAAGVAVGAKLTVVVTVQGGSGGATPTPLPSSTATPGVHPSSTTTPTPVG